MAEKFREFASVLSQEQVGAQIYSMWIQTERIAAIARPGQFVSVYCRDKAKLLPRPISLCEIDRENGRLRIVYRVTGPGTGTEEFSTYQAGDQIELLGPLGNGFPVERGAGRRSVLIGGGIGIPPMVALARELGCSALAIGEQPDGAQTMNERVDGEQAGGEHAVGKQAASAQSGNVQAVMGYRDAGTFLEKELSEHASLSIATEDGSVGTKGNVLDCIRENDIQADVIFACGPTPMLRAVKSYAEENGIECWLSLEERMACGIGACLACVCKSKELDEHSQVHNKRVCKEGPVFSAEDVEL